MEKKILGGGCHPHHDDLFVSIRSYSPSNVTSSSTRLATTVSPLRHNFIGFGFFNTPMCNPSFELCGGGSALPVWLSFTPVGFFISANLF